VSKQLTSRLWQVSHRTNLLKAKAVQSQKCGWPEAVYSNRNSTLESPRFARFKSHDNISRRSPAILPLLIIITNACVEEPKKGLPPLLIF